MHVQVVILIDLKRDGVKNLLVLFVSTCQALEGVWERAIEFKNLILVWFTLAIFHKPYDQ